MKSSLVYTLLLILVGCSSSGIPLIPEPQEPISKIDMIPSCHLGFSNTAHKRKAPPRQFLKDLFSFVSSTCYSNETLYGINAEPKDVFTHLSKFLTVNRSRPRRCANLFELMRVSGAMESSYNWNEGRDMSADNTTLYTMEVGIFQTSPNSHVYCKNVWSESKKKMVCTYPRWKYLDDLVAKYGVGEVSGANDHNNEKWHDLMMGEDNKNVIFEHHAFMLRHSYIHYGPMIDPERVGKNISKKCIAEVEQIL